MSILVVEDDRSSRMVLLRVLTNAGHSVIEAADGQTALGLLRRQTPKPSLILLDLMLPLMTGWELRNLLALEPNLADIPVAVISAVSHLAERTRELNVVAVLPKPIDLDRILELAARYDSTQG
ncbi:MAG TPA: response regulator [Roseiflexaceae bacterium]|nr:response regulator [Roseiflexaceae bacterium]